MARPPNRATAVEGGWIDRHGRRIAAQFTGKDGKVHDRVWPAIIRDKKPAERKMEQGDPDADFLVGVDQGMNVDM